MSILKQVQAVGMSLCLVVISVMAQAHETFGAAAAEPQNAQSSATASAKPSAEELKSLVAPIALYPDKLIAQILAASTYPTQIVEAQRWMEQHKNLSGEQLASAVNKQSWDPSVKGLTQFPTVLTNMSQNLSWTSTLGDAYFNVPKDVMAAIQSLRKSAESAGNLKSTPQQTVTNEGSTIIIQPASPQTVYVPTYSPAVYGAYVPPVYPGYSGWDMAAASALSFGVGMAVGAAWGHPWGWDSWGTSWHGGNVTYNHNTYISNSNTFANRSTQYSQYRSASDINRSSFNSQNLNRSMDQLNKPTDFPSADRFKSGGYSGMGGASTHDFQGAAENRGFSSEDHSYSGLHSSSFSGFSDGGFAHADSFHGESSFGGFGGDRSGGFDRDGGFGGGGFRGGGRR